MIAWFTPRMLFRGKPGKIYLLLFYFMKTYLIPAIALACGALPLQAAALLGETEWSCNINIDSTRSDAFGAVSGWNNVEVGQISQDNHLCENNRAQKYSGNLCWNHHDYRSAGFISRELVRIRRIRIFCQLVPWIAKRNSRSRPLLGRRRGGHLVHQGKFDRQFFRVGSRMVFPRSVRCQNKW